MFLTDCYGVQDYRLRIDRLAEIKIEVSKSRGYQHDKSDAYLELLVANWLNDHDPDWLADTAEYCYWE